VGSVLLPSYLKQPLGSNSSSGSANTLLFSFSPAAASVPADQQSIGYRLLR